MNPFISQVIFTSDNIEKLYLSPYCDIHETTQRELILERDDLNSFVISSNDSQEAITMLKYLKNGIELSDLREMLTVQLKISNADEWIGECLQKGIIE